MRAVVLPFPRTGTQYSPAVPLDIATVEKALMTQLAAALGGTIVNGEGSGTAVALEHFPDASKKYRLTHRIGAVLIRYDGCEYGAVFDTEAVAQERTFTWFFAIVMRDFGWAYGGQPSGTSPGAYQILETIRAALTGFIVTGFRKMYPAAEEYEGLDPEGGAYYFNARYRHVTIAVEAGTEPNFPLLTKAQVMDQSTPLQTPVASPMAPYSFSGPAPGALQLPQVNLSNIVVMSDDLSTEYVEGTDFSVAIQTGVVTRIATGRIAALATVQIAFDYADVVTAVAGGGAAPMQPSN